MEIDKAVEYYNKIKVLAENHGNEISEFRQIDYGIQFTIRTNLTSALVRIYQNKKGIVKVDTSQVKTDAILTFLSEIASSETLLNTSLINNKKKQVFQEESLTYPIIGTDESGKGDYFGPLVVVGSLINEVQQQKLEAVGVRDSKLIKDNKIFEIAKEIRSILPNDSYSVVTINPLKYNELYNKIGNLNNLLAWGHARAIENILLKNDSKNAIADQFGDEIFIKKALLERGKNIRLVQLPKAEQFIAVATSSILARECFLKNLFDLGKQLDMDLPKGASIEVESVARQLVLKIGMGSLPKYAKMHFKTSLKL